MSAGAAAGGLRRAIGADDAVSIATTTDHTKASKHVRTSPSGVNPAEARPRRYSWGTPPGTLQAAHAPECLHHPPYPDGAVDQVPFDALVDRIAVILAEEQPHVVATFGPDGITAHPDHIAVGAATDAAFARYAATPHGEARRLVHRVLPMSVFQRWQQQRQQMGLPIFDPTKVYHGRAVPDEQVHVTVDCRTVADQVVAGLLEHRSQLHVMADDPIDIPRLRRIVSTEWLAIAWPPRPASTATLTDIFQDLD